MHTGNTLMQKRHQHTLSVRAGATRILGRHFFGQSDHSRALKLIPKDAPTCPNTPRPLLAPPPLCAQSSSGSGPERADRGHRRPGRLPRAPMPQSGGRGLPDGPRPPPPHRQCLKSSHPHSSPIHLSGSGMDGRGALSAFRSFFSKP